MPRRDTGPLLYPEVNDKGPKLHGYTSRPIKKFSGSKGGSSGLNMLDGFSKGQKNPFHSGKPDYDKSVYKRIISTLRSYGLPVDDQIINVIKKGLVGGETVEAIRLELQETKTWKQRFKGNEMLRKKGLGVLSTAEYLSMERQYSSIMQSAGMPAGFYDDPEDFASWIGNSVSPSELQSRVGLAESVVNREDPEIMRELRRRGITKGDLMAQVMNPKRALPLLQKKQRSILFGAAAREAGTVGSRSMLNRLAANNEMSQSAVAQGYGQVAGFADDFDELSDIYGVDYDKRDAERDVFLNDQAAQEKREDLTQREVASFSGSAQYGTNKTSTTGQF